MKIKAAFVASLLLPFAVSFAAPTIAFIGGSTESVIVVLTNSDKEPYYYCSPFVDEVPNVIEFVQGGQKLSIGSHTCGTGAVWHRLEPNRSIHVVIARTPAMEVPGSRATLLIYDNPEKGRTQISGATIEMAKALEFMRSTGVDKSPVPSITSFVEPIQSDK